MSAQDLGFELKRIANELRPPKPEHLFSIIKTAEDVGTQVELQLHNADGHRHAQIDLGDKPPRIIIFRSSKARGSKTLSSLDEHLLTPKERFSIAHELGHLFAHQRFRLKPASEGAEYWKQEVWMNEFASRLLVPDWMVAAWLATIPVGQVVSPLSVRQWAKEHCRVSEEVVATELCCARKSIGFIKVMLTNRKKSDTPILKTLFSVCSGELLLPRFHSHIVHDELRRALELEKLGTRTFPKCQLGQCKPQDLTISWRRVNTLADVSNWNGDRKVSGKGEVFWLSIAVGGGLGNPGNYQSEPLFLNQSP